MSDDDGLSGGLRFYKITLDFLKPLQIPVLIVLSVGVFGWFKIDDLAAILPCAQGLLP